MSFISPLIDDINKRFSYSKSLHELNQNFHYSLTSVCKLWSHLEQSVIDRRSGPMGAGLWVQRDRLLLRLQPTSL